jgi:hypothetical protein
MKQSKLVTVPKKWKTNELAYITPAEKKALLKLDLHGNLKDGPHKGPGGVMSLNGWGDDDRGTSDASYGGGNVSGSGDNRDYSSHTATGEGGQTYTPTPTTSSHHPGGGNKKVSASNVGIATSVIRKNPFGAVASWVGKKLFSPKVPPDQAGGVSAKVIKRGGVKVSKKAISADRNRYTNLSHDQGDPGGEKHGPEGLMTTTLTTAPTADKSFGHQWDFKAYDNQQATTTPNVYDYSKAPYAKKGKLVRKYATGQEVKKRSLPPSKGPDSKGLPSILENSDYFTKLIGG